jgi:tetratricopeptide (TPR) repeat protein
MFAERWMYVPVAGFALVAGWACERIAREKLLPLVSAAVLTLAGLLGAARIQDWNSMERLARSSIRGYPNGAKVWNELGISLGERGLHEEAAEAFKRSVALEDDDPSAWKNDATALFNLGRYQESAASWRRVLALSRKDVGVLWKGLGQAELAAGERAAAAEHLEKARTLLPNDGEIAADLSRLSGTAGEETLRAKYEAAVRLEMQGLHAEAARLPNPGLTRMPLVYVFLPHDP